MTDEHRKQIDALIAAGEKAPHQLRAAARRIENIRGGYSDQVSCDCVNLALELEHANARPALKALVTRLELAEAVCESCRCVEDGFSCDIEMMYDEKALAAWRAAKEADDV